MKTGTVNTAKIIGICNRLRIAPKAMRQAIIQELIEAADDGAEITDALANVRGQLVSEKDPNRIAALVKSARSLRARLR